MNYKFTVLPFTTADDRTRAAFEMSEMEHAGYEVKGFSTRKGEITIAFRRTDAPVKAPETVDPEHVVEVEGDDDER